MVDNVTLPGTGVVVAAESVGGVDYQRVKVVDGTAGGTANLPLPLDAASKPSVPVQQTELPLTLQNFMQALTTLLARAADTTGGRLRMLLDSTGGSLTLTPDAGGNPSVPVSITELPFVLQQFFETMAQLLGRSADPSTGRLRILVDAITGALTLATVTTVGTVSAVTSVSQVGGVTITDMPPQIARQSWYTMVRQRFS